MIHGRIGKDAFLGRDVDLYFHAHYYGFSSSENTLKYINILQDPLFYWLRLILVHDKYTILLPNDPETPLSTRLNGAKYTMYTIEKAKVHGSPIHRPNGSSLAPFTPPRPKHEMVKVLLA